MRLAPGQTASLVRRFSSADIAEYAALTACHVAGDRVPEPLIGALFSRLLGVDLPGHGTNYLKQELTFDRDASLDDDLTATVTVTRLRPEKRLVDLATVCHDGEGQRICHGRALVRFDRLAAPAATVAPSSAGALAGGGPAAGQGAPARSEATAAAGAGESGAGGRPSGRAGAVAGDGPRDPAPTVVPGGVTEGWYFSDDRLRLFYRDYAGPAGNDRPPVLCLPGLTRNSRDFEELAALLVPRYRVITTDLRGRGHSEHDPNRRNYHPAQYARDIARLLDHLHLERLFIVGTSLGGLVAMLLAKRRVRPLAGVVLNDIGPEIDRRGLARVAASAGALPAVQDWESAAAAVKAATLVAFPDWSDQRWLAFARKMYEPAPGGGLDIRLDRNIGVAVREGHSGLREPPWRLFQALRHVPVLVVHGEQSDLLTPRILARMRRAKPDLTAVTVPNRGHAPNLDEPEAFDAIAQFLAKH